MGPFSTKYVIDKTLFLKYMVNPNTLILIKKEYKKPSRMRILEGEKHNTCN